MPDVVQVKAMIPRELKRRAFVVLAAREEKFSGWLRTQLGTWLREVENADEGMAIVEVDSGRVCRSE
jgi:hypothetical protein